MQKFELLMKLELKLSSSLKSATHLLHPSATHLRVYHRYLKICRI